MSEMSGPQFLHVITKKGKGFLPAEENPIKYHALHPKAAPQSAAEKNCAPKPKLPSYSNVFGQWLCDMAGQDQRLIGITPAMREGSDMIRFSELYPQRYHDVAIAEQHAVTFAAGLACQGAKPVVAIYSTFLQRAYDQLIHDVAIQNLDVLFAIDRAGLVGADGCTHDGSFDLSFLRCIPNMIIMAPSDENQCRQMLYTGYEYKGPAAVRYPRGTGTGVIIEEDMQAIELGSALLLKESTRSTPKVALLSFGSMLEPATAVAQSLDATLVDMRFIKPLDTNMIAKLAASHDLLVTLEENVISGGAGSGVNEYIAYEGLACPVLNIGLPDRFIPHGTVNELHQEIGIDAPGIEATIVARLAKLAK
jgi:1-deoxy-D-xylulose-5-phosphate synthase